MALLCRFRRLLHMFCYATRVFEQSGFLRFLSCSSFELLSAALPISVSHFTEVLDSNGFNIFILIIFVKRIIKALVFLYFFAKFCRIDMFVACGRYFPAKKLYCCVELWNTKSNVVMTYGIFPVATIVTIAAETNSHMIILIAMIAQHRSLRSSR